MTARGVADFRGRRGWTREEMADEVGVSPLEVEAWEAGTVAVPREQARRIREIAVDDHRRAAVRAAGPPACRWAKAHVPRMHELLADGAGAEALAFTARQHAARCRACGRLLWMRQMMPAPLDPGLGSDPLESTERFLGESPVLAGFRGWFLAGVTVALSGWMVADALPGRDWNEKRAAAYGVAACIGAGWLLKRLPKVGPFAAGMIQGPVGAFTALLAWMTITGAHSVEPGVVAGVAVLGMGVGVVAGRLNRSLRTLDTSDAPAFPVGYVDTPAPLAALRFEHPAPGMDGARAPADPLRVPRSSD